MCGDQESYLSRPLYQFLIGIGCLLSSEETDTHAPQ
jgi:hypothetical protein